MKKFPHCDTKVPHYYVFETFFVDFGEAVVFCDRNNIPYDFIVKTKYIIDLG